MTPTDEDMKVARKLCGALSGGALDDWDGLAIPIIARALASQRAKIEREMNAAKNKTDH